MTEHTLALIFMRDKKKIGEILRFQRYLDQSGMQPADLAEITGVSERTITNAVYQNIPLGGKFLRELLLKLGVSTDWLLTGNGHMYVNRPDQVEESSQAYPAIPPTRIDHIADFLREWSTYASDQEQIWLEQEMRFRLPQFADYMDKNSSSK